MFASRFVRVGGKSRDELRKELEHSGVKLNQAGEEILKSPAFITCAQSYLLECVEVTVSGLGHPDGAAMEALLRSATELDLALCPLEVGPHLRLQYLDQPEGFLGHAPSQHRAPPGSLTVASPPLSADHDVPTGFYLRKISGELWLRGYRSAPEHPWSPEDHLLFCRPSGTA